MFKRFLWLLPLLCSLAFGQVGGKSVIGGKAVVGGPSSGGGGMTFVQGVGSTTGGNGTGNIAVTIAASGSGHMLIFWSGSNTFTSITDNLSQVWTAIPNLTGATACFHSQFTAMACQAWYICNTASGVTSVTASGGATFTPSGQGVIEIGGTASTSCLVSASAPNPTASGTLSSTSAVVSGSSTLIGLFTSTNPATLTPAGGYLSGLTAANFSGTDLLIDYQLNISATPQTATATSAAGGAGSIIIVH